MAYLMREKFEQRPDPELLNCVLDAIIVIGPSLELTYANDAAKAYLALVGQGDGRSDSEFQICAGHDDVRVAASELQHCLFQVAAGGRCHRSSSALASGERYRGNARILDYRLDFG